jgi:predicted HTH domain antitoxin
LDRSALVKKVLVEGLQQERLNFAIQKYMMKDISIERVAEIAKLSIHEFISNLSKLGVPSNLTIEEIEKII